MLAHEPEILCQHSFDFWQWTNQRDSTSLRMTTLAAAIIRRKRKTNGE